ncbi:unnamed protein product, partial [Mesorhabditis belari]|uniref:DUF148 domain-containing protein n=1 Tax=Mesorhabditis belari TaxID=2138241 RepID=A0AAF3FH03_9BILA
MLRWSFLLLLLFLLGIETNPSPTTVAKLNSHEEIVQYFYVLFPKREQRPYIPSLLVPYMAPSPHQKALAFFLPGPLAEWVQTHNPFEDPQEFEKNPPFNVGQYPAIPLKDLPPIPREIARQMQLRVEETFDQQANGEIRGTVKDLRQKWEQGGKDEVEQILADPELSDEQIEKMLKELVPDESRRMMSAGKTHQVIEALDLSTLKENGIEEIQSPPSMKNKRKSLKKRRRRKKKLSQNITTTTEAIPVTLPEVASFSETTTTSSPNVSTTEIEKKVKRMRIKRIGKKFQVIIEIL